jgi:hypothetical protein
MTCQGPSSKATRCVSRQVANAARTKRNHWEPSTPQFYQALGRVSAKRCWISGVPVRRYH